MFLWFANFYRRFIQWFSQIAAPLTSILKTLSTKLAKPRKNGVRINNYSRAGPGGSGIDRNGMDNVKVDGGEVEVDEIEKKVQKSSKSKKTVRSSDFLTLEAKQAFTKLGQAFFKTPILHHFNLERDIRIKIDVSGYTIGEVLS